MKKIKNKIKRAIYAFFKEEIESYLHLNDKIKIKEVIVEGKNVIKISKKLTFDKLNFDTPIMHPMQLEVEYRKQIYNLKQEVFLEVEPYMIISKDLLKSYPNNQEIFEISLYIVKSKEEQINYEN